MLISLGLKRLMICLVFATFLMPSSMTLNAATNGGKCPKAGLTQKTKNILYKCVKKGKTTVWVIPSGANSTSPNTATETYLSPTQVSDSAELCKLKDKSQQRIIWGSLLSGFPTMEKNFEKSGKFTIAFIPIDFVDQIGTGDPVAAYKDQMQIFVDYYDMVSEGKVKFEWKTYNTWVRVTGSISEFSVARSGGDYRIATAALAAADPIFDFTGVRAVYFVLPQGQTAIKESAQGFLHGPFGTSGGYQTNEGRIVNFALHGNYFDVKYRTVWSYWAHETGHMFPLPDLYEQRGNGAGGVALAIPIGPFSGFDLMSTQDGPSRTISSWLRFVQGWLDDGQVFCKPFANLQSTQVMLNPIDSRSVGYKAVMIPTSETRLVIIESRRPSAFDCPSPERVGVIVYTVDTTISHGEGIQHLVAPATRSLRSDFPTCATPPQVDAILKPGDSVTADGVKVSVLKSGKYDTVEISK